MIIDVCTSLCCYWVTHTLKVLKGNFFIISQPVHLPQVNSFSIIGENQLIIHLQITLQLRPNKHNANCKEIQYLFRVLIENMVFLTSLIFIFEIYHVVTHILVMTGYRTLPRKALSKQKYYFLVDLLTSSVSFMIHGRFWPIILLQNIQHAFYFLTWPDHR